MAPGPSGRGALLALVLVSCGRPELPLRLRTYVLNLGPDEVLLDGSPVDLRREAGGADGLVLGNALRGERVRRALFLGDGHELTLPGLGGVPGERPQLRFDLGAPAAGGAPARLAVLARDGPDERTLWSRRVDPDDDAPWLRVAVALSGPPGSDLVLRARAAEPGGSAPGPGSMPAWGTPVVERTAPVAPLAEPPRSVVLFLVDTLRADRLGLYGNPRETAPELARVAREALVFERAVAPSSWTKPSVASLFTGLPPSEHRARRVQSVLASSVPTLAETFRDAGYRTAAFGSNGWVFGGSFGLGRGFEDFSFVVDQGASESARSDAVVDRAIDWVTRHAHEPFFLYVHTIDPHAPYDPPAELAARFCDPAYDGRLDGSLSGAGTHVGHPPGSFGPADVEHLRDLYDAEIAFDDEQLGRLVERLRALGLWEELTFAFTSDHGEAFLDHGSWGHGWSLYQEQLHVPLVIKPPASRGLAPRRVARVAGLADVGATLLELAGVPRPVGGVAGRSLLLPRDAPVVSELTQEGVHRVAVRDGERKYVVRFEHPPVEEVYLLDRDPGETTDARDELPTGELERLRSLARERRLAAQEEGLRIELLGDGAEHEVVVEVVADEAGGDVGLLAPEPADRLALEDDAPEGRTEVRAVLALGPGDTRDGLVWRGPAEAELSVRVRVDGGPLPLARFRIGAERRPARARPVVLRADDPSLAVASVPAPRRVEQVLCRIWSHEPESATIDPELRASLEALGYLGADR